jgi:hypothetical protein
MRTEKLAALPLVVSGTSLVAAGAVCKHFALGTSP